ncbi:uncharacterized protein [Amphiura filiformis]|uniref:uncharacterized protein n=1 Tax=Amphiura filiformis TaxID=82378 RepID=UPI003B21E742
MSRITSIPIVDFSAYSLEKDKPDTENFQKLIDEIYEAFSTIGFVYLKNFGVPEVTGEKIKRVFDKSREFFQLDSNVKQKYLRPYNSSNHGYIQSEREGLNPDRPYKDLKEGFNFTPSAPEVFWPDEEMPSFREALTDLFNECIPLHNRVLEVMARGLKLEDPMIFVKAHKKMGTTENPTTLRTLFYPPTRDKRVKEGQVRCGEHSDYGGITLLFQDSQGGLEVRNVQGDYIKAPPIDGTVVINIADFMQRWTADTLVSTNHRVMMPQTDDQKQCIRQSIAFFGHPDKGEMITCIDGSNKYPPIESMEYLDVRFNATYGNTPQADS